MKCCINGGNVIRLLFLSAKLLNFEIQKSGQILCAHKPYFLITFSNIAIFLYDTLTIKIATPANPHDTINYHMTL